MIDRATGQNGFGVKEDIAQTLNATDRHGVYSCNQGGMDGSPCIDRGPPVICLEPQALSFQERAGKPGGGKGILIQNEKTCSLSTLNNQAVYDARGNGGGEIVPTITGDHQNRVTDYTAICVGNGQLHNISMSEQANTLDTMHDQQAVLVPEIAHALKAKANLQFQEDSETYPMDAAGVVRRLTPLENERLQGMPDDWSKYGVNEKGEVYELSDTARYVLQGNGIARPFWTWLLRRIAAQYERPATLGSLFDGQAGFPLCWVEVGGIPVWCSEIEKNAVAVSKYHFPDEGSD